MPALYLANTTKGSNVVFEHPFYFLRHGETEWNRTRRTQGQLDSQLNDAGREQAMHAAERLRAPLPNAVPLHVSPGEGTWSQRLVGE